jgi:hypothetical protein
VASPESVGHLEVIVINVPDRHSLKWLPPEPPLARPFLESLLGAKTRRTEARRR